MKISPMKTGRATLASMALCLMSACLVLPSVSGCSKEQRDAFASRAKNHKHQVETTALRERVMEYWDAMRWQNWQEASTFFLEPQDQIEFLRSHSGNASNGRMDQIEIEYAFIEPEHGQSAEVRVAWKVVIPTQAKVQQQLTTQHWLKKFGRWWISSAADAAEATKAAAIKDEDDSQ